MAKIIRDGSAALWRPDLYKIFSLLSLTQTPVRIRTCLQVNNAPATVVLTASIMEVDGLECLLTVTSVDFTDSSGIQIAPFCDYSAVIRNCAPGSPQLVEYSGNARILRRHDNAETGLPDEMRMHFSLPGKVRPLRRHARQDCAQFGDIMPGLALLDSEFQSRRQLLALMRHYYNKKARYVPHVVNMSAGGVCLQTEDVIARRLTHGTDRYLFFFFLRSPLEEKVPWVFLGRKAGGYRVAGSQDRGLRIHFLRELSWVDSARDLRWNNIAVKGSANLGAALEDMKKISQMAKNLNIPVPSAVNAPLKIDA